MPKRIDEKLARYIAQARELLIAQEFNYERYKAEPLLFIDKITEVVFLNLKPDYPIILRFADWREIKEWLFHNPEVDEWIRIFGEIKLKEKLGIPIIKEDSEEAREEKVKAKEKAN